MDKRKLSLAELIARKEKPLRQTAEVFVPGMGGTVEIRRLPLVEYQELSSAYATAKGGGETLQAIYDMIYAFVPILHSQELLDAYGCKGAPTDVVPLVFREDVGDMVTVINAVGALYGDGAEARDEVKN